MLQSFLLLVVSLLPYWYELLNGEGYSAITLLAGFTTLLMGIVMLWLGRRLQRSGTREDAKRLFLFSLAYLPLVLIVLALDKRLQSI